MLLAGDSPVSREEGAKPSAPTIDELLDKANEVLLQGKEEEAGEQFYAIQRLFPDDEKAALALWQAAQLRKKIALRGKNADWERVRDTFRLFINYYPKDKKAPDAYLELGKAYSKMKFYREALTYFKLFVKRYPDSPLVLEANLNLGEAMVKVGRYREAEKMFSSWLNGENHKLKLYGSLGMGSLYVAQKKYNDARRSYQHVLITAPDYYLTNPDILRRAGIANVESGKLARGRKQLFHYLNLESFSLNRSEVLFVLGESYLREKNGLAAQKVYEKVVSEGQETDRFVLLSKLRVAQYLDDPKMKISKWAKHNDLKDETGDGPYLAVLERFFNDSFAQEARYGLFLRYKARGGLDKAYETGKSYLRNSVLEDGAGRGGDQVGNILLYLVGELLKNKRYQEIYDLYFVEYRHVKDFPDGRLLYMVGQAMEALNLYDQAAVVYFRALKWPISDHDKVDLYFRRARVYLAKHDYESADRLLTFLRKIYKGSKSIGEINYLSGKLAEAQTNKKGALLYYKQAVENPTFSEKETVYVDDALRLSLEFDQNVAALTLLRKALKKEALDRKAAQGWFLKIGNSLRLTQEFGAAIDAYQEGLAKDLPQVGEHVQAINLYLGDSYFAQGKKEQGAVHYQKAKEGEDTLWKKMATERLNQNEIDKELAAMKKVSGVRKK